MQSQMAADTQRVIVLATGGTIAGQAAAADDGAAGIGYRAAQLGVGQLIAAVPPMARHPLETEQLAQIDSKDMDFAVWQALARRVEHHLARPDVAGIVITHGTDTLEETAYFLQRLLAPAKPVVLTGSMRPANALLADGPQNLLDAVCLAFEPGASGVLAVLAGTVHGALDVRKTHTHRLDAFGSGDAGPIARIEGGRLRRLRDWPSGIALGGAALVAGRWPRVEIVLSHAGASGAVVEALVAQGVEGLVASATGNGTLHHALEAALRRAQAAGVAVRRATRVAEGPLLEADGAELPAAGHLRPLQARIELMLELMLAARDGSR
jgi:L-asparaginase